MYSVQCSNSVFALIVAADAAEKGHQRTSAVLRWHHTATVDNIGQPVVSENSTGHQAATVSNAAYHVASYLSLIHI